MSISCPCGGSRAYSRDEMIAFDLESVDIADRRTRVMTELSWRQLLGPDDFYCPHEDDVLLPSEIEAAKS